MKLAIIGSRSYSDYVAFCHTMGEWFSYSHEGAFPIGHEITEVISGGAPGVDTMAERWAYERGVLCRVIRPDYKVYPPHEAPLVRNGLIAEACDVMVAFWTGEPKSGTRNAIGHATRLKKTTLIVYV